MGIIDKKISGEGIPLPYKTSVDNDNNLIFNNGDADVAIMGVDGSKFVTSVTTGVGSFHLGDIHSIGSAGNRAMLVNNCTGNAGVFTIQKCLPNGTVNNYVESLSFGDLTEVEPSGAAGSNIGDYRATIAVASNLTFFYLDIKVAEDYSGYITWIAKIGDDEISRFKSNKTFVSGDIVRTQFEYPIFILSGQSVDVSIIKEDKSLLQVYLCSDDTPYRKTFTRTWAINKVVQEEGNNIIPSSNNTINLGNSTTKFKDAYLSGDLYVGDDIIVGSGFSISDGTNNRFVLSATTSALMSTGDTFINTSVANGNVTIGHWGNGGVKSNVTLQTPTAGEVNLVCYNGSNMKLSDDGAYINTTNPNLPLTVGGYTKLGSNAPAIKMKKITGTTPPTGSSRTYTTNIAQSKILAINVLATNDYGVNILPNHGTQAIAPEYYFAVINAGGELLIALTNESTTIDNRPFTCLITYEE